VIDLFFSLPRKDPHLKLHSKSISWIPPPPGFSKLNTDGSSCNNPGLASAGGLLRDSNDNWISGYYIKIGFTTSLAAELRGLRDGLYLAIRFNINKIVIDVDAPAVVTMLNNEHNTSLHSHHYSVLLDDYRVLI
jgi:hypothetical protein